LPSMALSMSTKQGMTPCSVHPKAADPSQ
jgi:hypothetical protein